MLQVYKIGISFGKKVSEGALPYLYLLLCDRMKVWPPLVDTFQQVCVSYCACLSMHTYFFICLPKSSLFFFRFESDSLWNTVVVGTHSAILWSQNRTLVPAADIVWGLVFPSPDWQAKQPGLSQRCVMVMQPRVTVWQVKRQHPWPEPTHVVSSVLIRYVHI